MEYAYQPGNLYQNRNEYPPQSNSKKHENLSFKRNYNNRTNSPKNHSNFSKSNLYLTNQFFRRFTFIILIFIFIGILIICVCVFFQIFERKISCYTNESQSSWSNWSKWVQFNETSRLFVRRRNCITIVKNISNQCEGSNEEFFKCRDKDLITISSLGIWSIWSQWSSCNDQCKTHNKIPIRTRNRICMDSEDKKEITSCFGQKIEYQFCNWLSECSNSHWSEWKIIETCTLREKTPCGPGHQAAIRKCLQQNCTGSNEKLLDCWSYIGCPIDLQPPLNVELISYGNGIFKISWSIVPFGEIAQKVWIYLTMMSYSGKEINTLFQDINVYHDNVAIRNYAIHLNYTQYLAAEYFHVLSIRLQSVNINDSKSILTEPVSSIVRAIDGEWSQWGNWGLCSTECLGERGLRIRTRECNNPFPSHDGKKCPGFSETSVSCMGLDDKSC